MRQDNPIATGATQQTSAQEGPHLIRSKPYSLQVVPVWKRFNKLETILQMVVGSDERGTKKSIVRP